MRGWKNPLKLSNLPSAPGPDARTKETDSGGLLQSRKFLSLGDDGDDQKQYGNNQETQRDGPGDENRKIPTGQHQ